MILYLEKEEKKIILKNSVDERGPLPESQVSGDDHKSIEEKVWREDWRITWSLKQDGHQSRLMENLIQSQIEW